MDLLLLMYVEKMLGLQLPNFTELGMFNEGGNPMPYDLFHGIICVECCNRIIMANIIAH